jgi:hypothetical protein
MYFSFQHVELIYTSLMFTGIKNKITANGNFFNSQNRFAALSSMVTYVTLDLSRPVRGIMNGDIGVQAIININNRLD